MEGADIASRKRTLNQFIRARQNDYPDAIGDFSEVMNAIALGAKMISREINLAGLVDTMGYTGKTNVQGEPVAKLDEWSNDLLVNLLGETGYVCALGSEEVEDPIAPDVDSTAGQYAVLFDPVDGSSNIDIAAPVRTIFSIQHRVTDSGSGNLEDLLQPGSKQVAAGYVLYGSSDDVRLHDRAGCACIHARPDDGRIPPDERRFEISCIGGGKK